MNKKLFKIGLIMVVVLSLTGCFGNKMKNAKTVNIQKGTAKAEVTYPDDGEHQLLSVGSTQIIKNEKENFKIIVGFENRTISEQKKQRARFKKGTGPIFKDVEYNGYKGYAQISKVSGSTQVYLFVDTKNDVVLSAKISSVDLNKTIDDLLDKKTGQIKKGKKAEDALFNKKGVQEILKTLKYEQVKETSKPKTKKKKTTSA